MDVNDIARVAHEVNKEFCVSIGDTTQTSWVDAPDWQRQSAVNGVNFHINNPDAPASSSHDSWMKEKVDDGWVYGELKDPDATPPTHHCIVPFEELPVEQQSKDFIFRSVVHALQGHLD